MNEITLRDYQDEGVFGIRNSLARNRNHLICQAATGAGKTVIFSYISQKASLKGNKVLIITDREELLNQTGGAINKFGINPYYIKAGTKYVGSNSNVFVAMCETLRNRLKLDKWKKWLLKEIDLIIIDECHRQNFNYLFISGLLDKKTVLGFTATPKRGGSQRQLALDYDEIIPISSTLELVKRGYLVSDDYFGIKGVDTEKIKFDYMKGDYSEKDMFTRFNSPQLYAGVVKNYQDICPGSHTIIFCVNIEHIIRTCEEFNKKGIKAKFVCSKVGKPKPLNNDADDADIVKYNEKLEKYYNFKYAYEKWSGDRSEIVNQFKRKEFSILINAGILTTGFDCPEIETVIVNRATTSLTLWYQMLGRGSRISKGKSHFNILDFGGNADRLGHYLTPQPWSLWHEKGDLNDGVPPVKECGGKPDKYNNKGCERLIMASMKICPFCGYVYEDKKEEKEVDLVGLAYDSEKRKAILVKKPKDMNTDELWDYFKLKKHKMAWLWRQLYFKGGNDLIREFGKSKNWSKNGIENAILYCKGF